MTKRIHDILLELGVPANLKGHEALTIGIELVISDPTYLNRGVTTRLYPEVAQRMSIPTTGSRVERAMRHAIEAMHDHTDPEVVGEYFGHVMSASKGKLTNSQFIAQVATKLRDQMAKCTGMEVKHD
jgi:two-component system response regulator (stage 0 sporulation protein A)